MDKTIINGTEARKRILAGVSMLEDIVVSTLGPKGHNVIIQDGGVRPLITKDGASVAKKVDSSDPFKKIGIELAMDVVSKVDSEAGDGTTTTTLFFAELIKEMSRLVDLGIDANALRRGMSSAITEAIEILQKKAVQVEDIEAIASVSTNQNEELTKLLVEAYNSIGENGSVVLADSYKRDGSSYVEVSKGIKWSGGIPSTLFITNVIDDTAVIPNPYIMVFASGLSSLEDLSSYIDVCKVKERKLVIVAPFFEPEIFSQAASLGVTLLTSPGTSYDHVELHDALMDLAITVGTKVIPDAKSASSVCPDLEDLGTAKLVVASIKETNITQVEELEEKKAIAYENYIQKLKKTIDDDDGLAIYTMEALKDRLGRLSGGIATIHIGALTPTEKEEKIALLTDAQNSIAAALKYGVLPGGGTALLKVAHELENKPKSKDEAFQRGFDAVTETMRKPAEVLVKSVKPKDYQYIVQQIANEKEFNKGYNVRTEQEEDLLKSKVIDSAAIEIFALKYSASVIGSFIIADGVIVNTTNNLSYDVNDRKVVEAYNGR